ncbi:MAG: hypothetical protein KJO38_03115, partial [Gammaproteobacteria bacterium]|nr:hypothetical protein [Gammaproteobacteria bacterium]
LKLFCCPVEKTSGMKAISTFEEAARFERDNCFIDHFIRNDHLEQDLLDALRNSGMEITDTDANRFASSPRTNRSSRNKGPEHYYDAASSKLVREREKLIVDKFGYAPPVLKPAAAPGHESAPNGAPAET